LIRRYTKNVTILYDGDAAGIKASMRGIDMILEEGLNVRIVLFPDGEDPDSYARKHSQWEVQEFISKNAADFILFKAQLLLDEAANDPIKKAATIRSIMDSIAKIGDPIIRAEYTRVLSVKMNMNEQILISEMNKIRTQTLRRSTPDEPMEDLLPQAEPEPQADPVINADTQELYLIKLMLLSGEKQIEIEWIEESEPPVIHKELLPVSKYIIQHLEDEGIQLENPLYKNIFEEYKTKMKEADVEEFELLSGMLKYFLSHSDEGIRNLTAEISFSKYQLSPNWNKFKIIVPNSAATLKKDTENAIIALQKFYLMKQGIELVKRILETPSENEDAYIDLQVQKKNFDDLKKAYAKIKGTVIM
jgi:DNA primase